MKQFFTIFKFEYLTYAKNKAFVGITLGVVLLLGLLLSFPRISGYINLGSLFNSEDSKPQVIALQDFGENNLEDTLTYLKSAMPDKEFIVSDLDKEALISKINDNTYAGALILNAPSQYEYIVESISMTDTTHYEINALLTSNYQMNELKRLGISDAESSKILDYEMKATVIQTGKDQVNNFLFTYILIFLLYMVILLYGQSVASSVATEKSTRTMEVLITSAKPINLIFGKVFGTGLAGLSQMILILGASFLFFNLNKAHWGTNELMSSIFDIPFSTLLYAILFFILGYFIYSFIFGGLGSLVSKIEDISSATLPITLVFIASFIVVMFSMSSGNIDSPLMIFASYFPLSSPMAMFARITMGDVSGFEILVSALILIASTFLIAYFSAKVYKKGVLLYGKLPKLAKLLKEDKKH